MAQILLKTNYRKLGILDEKKYLTTALRYSTISVDDLIKYAAENSGLSKANVAAVFYALAQQIEQFACEFVLIAWLDIFDCQIQLHA